MRNNSVKFTPQDDFSKSLIKSIPSKITAWLQNMNMLKRQKGSYGVLTWRIRNNTGKSVVQIGDITIEWNGSVGNISNVSITEQWVENLGVNMEKFIALEKRIYDVLQKCEDEFYEQQAVKIHLHDRILPTPTPA